MLYAIIALSVVMFSVIVWNICLEYKFNKYKKQNKQEHTDCNSQITVCKNEIDALKKTTIAQDSIIHILQLQTNCFSNELTTIKENIVGMNDNISVINEKLANLINITNKLDEESQKQKNEITELTNNINELEANAQWIETEINKLTDKIFSKNTEIENEIINLKKTFDFYKNPEKISIGLNDTEVSGEFSEDKQIKTNVDLDDEQKEALDLLNNTTENIFITGMAGSGKSFLLEQYRNNHKGTLIVMAPTGISAINVNGVTIHSVFGFDNLEKTNIENLSEDTLSLIGDKKTILRKATALVIDEIGMVNADVFEKINIILQIINKNELPFGGKRIIIFGDVFQLPPIANKEFTDYLVNKYGGIYFFNAPSYNYGAFKFIELKHNHRQNGDDVFFDMLNRIREGNPTNKDIAQLNQRLITKKLVTDLYTTIVPTRKQASEINTYGLDLIANKEYTYTAKIAIKPGFHFGKNTSFPVEEQLILKENALIMLVNNDAEGKWVNGTLGIVKKLTDDSIFVAIEGKEYQVHKTHFQMQEVHYNEGKIFYETTVDIEQYPIILAYAMTIHKSQGQTYRSIACDIEHSFATGQAYVALSRCKSLDGLHLLSLASQGNIKVDKKVIDFYNKNREIKS